MTERRGLGRECCIQHKLPGKAALSTLARQKRCATFCERFLASCLAEMVRLQSNFYTVRQKPLLCFWRELSENEHLICAGKSVGDGGSACVPCDELQGVCAECSARDGKAVTRVYMSKQYNNILVILQGGLCACHSYIYLVFVLRRTSLANFVNSMLLICPLLPVWPITPPSWRRCPTLPYDLYCLR